MDTKYIIEAQTLKDIADSIRTKEGSLDEIQVDNFAERVNKIEPSTEEYMRISDYSKYPVPLNENDYSKIDISKCQQLINFYKEMEETTNG